MVNTLNGLPGLVMLLVGLLAGWFARHAWWWLTDFGKDAADRTRHGFEAFGKFLGRLLLLGLVLAAGVFALAAIPHGH